MLEIASTISSGNSQAPYEFPLSWARTGIKGMHGEFTGVLPCAPCYVSEVTGYTSTRYRGELAPEHLMMHMLPYSVVRPALHIWVKIKGKGSSVPDLLWLARDELTSRESPVIFIKVKKYVVIHVNNTPSPQPDPEIVWRGKWAFRMRLIHLAYASSEKKSS